MSSTPSAFAVIGGGISGISVARMLREAGCDADVFEAAPRIGGLIRCNVEQGRLFHRVGGHVFNTRDPWVREWFWRHFDRETEFLSARRQARILLGAKVIGYPIENSLHELEADLVGRIVDDLLARVGRTRPWREYPHFAAFLQDTFGPTLYELYFRPYNEKIWRTDLAGIPLHWLEGKLPMPDLRALLVQAILRREESEMVHSTFFYPRRGGSQFIVERLADGLNLRLGHRVDRIEPFAGGVTIGGRRYRGAIWTGDVRTLAGVVTGLPAAAMAALAAVRGLRANGTSSLLCACDPTSTSWLYLPEPGLRAHRIIYTGGFAPSNNGASTRSSCVVEFSGRVEREEMELEARRLPGRLEPLAHNHEPNSYILHDPGTAAAVAAVRAALRPAGVHLLGRFGEWQYYNMDKCMEAARGLVLLLTAPVGGAGTTPV